MKLEHSEKSAGPQAGNQGPIAKRRKLIQTGVAGAPLLLTLKSLPALAADCKQPSGFSASGNLSKNGTNACANRVNGITYWQTFATNNPTDADLDRPFNEIFSSSDTTTMRQLLGSGTLIQKQIIAAWRSARPPVSTALFTADQVVQMWNLGVVGGAYPVGAGVTWNATQVGQYLTYVLFP